MADINLSLLQVQDLLHTITARALGYDIFNEDQSIADEAAARAAREIRNSWPKDGAPAWKVDQDIVFIRASSEPDPYTYDHHKRVIHKNSDTYTEQMEMTNVWTVSWLFYGPNSYSRAITICTNIFDPELQIMYAQNAFFPIKNFNVPSRIPELYQGQWWERVDLKIKFNAQIRINKERPYFKSVHIEIEEAKGDNESVDIGP